MEATAKHDFQGTAGDELSFSRGAKLKVSDVNTAVSFKFVKLSYRLFYN